MFDTAEYLIGLRDLFATTAKNHGHPAHAAVITIQGTDAQAGISPGTIEILTAPPPERGTDAQRGVNAATVIGQFHARQKATVLDLKANGIIRPIGHAALQADNDPGFAKHEAWANRSFNELRQKAEEGRISNPISPDDKTTWGETIENWTRDRTPTNLAPLTPRTLRGQALPWKNISPSPSIPDKAVWLAPGSRLDATDPARPAPETQLKVFPHNVGRQQTPLPFWQWCYVITPKGPRNGPRIAQPDLAHYKTSLLAKKKAEDFAQELGWTPPHEGIAYPILWGGSNAQMMLSAQTTGAMPLPEIDAPLTDGALLKAMPELDRPVALAVYRNPLVHLDRYKPQRPPEEDMDVLTALQPDPTPIEVTVDRFGYVVPWNTLPGRPRIGTVPGPAVSDLPDNARALLVHLDPKHPPLVLTTIKQDIPYAIISKFEGRSPGAPEVFETRIHTNTGHTIHLLPPPEDDHPHGAPAGHWDILLDGKPLATGQVERRFDATLPPPEHRDEPSLLAIAIRYLIPQLI